MEVANVFDEMGKYWVEIADNHHTEQQIRFLKKQLAGGGCILDLACGAGRHTISLRNEGYKIVGLDASANLLKIGKQREAGVMLVCGDMHFLPFREKTFSAVISMDTSIGYLPTEKEDAESLAEARRVLKKGGVFLVDVFNRLNLITKYQDKAQLTKNFEYHSFRLQQKRQLSENGKMLCDTWIIHDKPVGETRVFKHIVRLYDFNQLSGLLESVCFAVKKVFGSYEEQEFSADSSRLIIIATAK